MSQTSHGSDSSSRIVQNDHVESSSVDEESSEVPASGTRPMKKGPWTAAEDAVLKDYVKQHGRGNWNAVQKKTRLARCGKSCRLRWSNHLRANLKKGAFTPEEERTIIRLQSKLGNKWAKISEHLEGRTDNEIKNYWNTRIKRCHRTGAPLYPPDVVPQGTADNPNGGKDDRAQPVRRQSNEDVESTGSDIPPVFFENLRRRSHPFHFQSLFSIPLADLLGKSPGSYGFNIPRPPSDCPRPFPAPETTSTGMPSCSQLLPSPRIDLPMGVNIPYDPEPPDGYFPASQAPPEAMKPELPSLQYSVLDLGDSLDCSPPPPTHVATNTCFESPLEARDQIIPDHYFPPRNDGLLESVVYEARALATARYRSTELISETPAAATTDAPIQHTACPNLGAPYSVLGHSAPPAPDLHKTPAAATTDAPIQHTACPNLGAPYSVLGHSAPPAPDRHKTPAAATTDAPIQHTACSNLGAPYSLLGHSAPPAMASTDLDVIMSDPVVGDAGRSQLEDLLPSDWPDGDLGIPDIFRCEFTENPDIDVTTVDFSILNRELDAIVGIPWDDDIFEKSKYP